MLLSQDIKPISYLKAKTASVINDVNENQRTIIITQNGEAKAVIQDIKTFENLMQYLKAKAVGKSFFVYKWKNFDISLPRTETKVAKFIYEKTETFDSFRG